MYGKYVMIAVVVVEEGDGVVCWRSRSFEGKFQKEAKATQLLGLGSCTSAKAAACKMMTGRSLVQGKRVYEGKCMKVSALGPVSDSEWLLQS